MMAMMWKSGKGKRTAKVLELICKGKCRQPYTFHQQTGWEHHFLPICSCKENPYFQIPDHIDKSQYRTYMKLATTEKNQLIFCYKGINNE